jgi:phospholipase A1
MSAPRFLCASTFLVALAGSAGAALAEVPASSAGDCHAIADGMERLACYDRVSGRAAGAPKEAAPAAQPAAVEPARTERAAAVPAPKVSLLDEAWDFDPSSPRYDLRFYRSNYLLVARYTDNVNSAPYVPIADALGQPVPDINSTEAKFQFSFKGRLWTTDDRRWGVWAAYTQQSQWQVYNNDASRPFRETNYMPELFVSYRPDVELGGGFRWGLLNAGYVHQSNGRTDILSRSWDRLFAEVGVERENLALSARLWYRIPESESEDDNPDITDYYGIGEIGALYRWRGHSFSGVFRGNVRTGKGSVQVGWFSPPLLGPLRGYVQVFSGYGESMIDYNWKQTTIGAGIALSDGL